MTKLTTASRIMLGFGVAPVALVLLALLRGINSHAV